jgi:hypothetical protein
MAERPESIIEPIPPSTNPVLERFFDYLNEPLRTEDPLKNLLAGVIGTDKRMGAGDFIPGLSTALARRRGDSLGEALSYLDFLGGGGTGVKLGSIFLIERKRQLEKAIKDIDDGIDPILSKNPFTRIGLVEELSKVKKQIAADKETAKRYGEITDKVLGRKGITSQLPDEMKPFMDEIISPNTPKGNISKLDTPSKRLEQLEKLDRGEIDDIDDFLNYFGKNRHLEGFNPKNKK